MALSTSTEIRLTPINCQLCETEKDIQWKCLECKLLMCNNCRDKIHPKFRNADDHKIIDKKDVGHQNEEVDFTNIKCNAHSGQYSCLFCKKCDNLVCPTCVSKVHKKHANDLIEIREAYEMKIDRLKNKQTQFDNAKASMTTKKDHLDQLKAAENSKYMKVKQDIRTHKKSLKKIVKKYFEELERELDNSCKSVLQPVDHHLSAIIGSIQEVENKKDQVKDFINTTNATAFFQEIRDIEKSVELIATPTTTMYISTSIPKFIPGEITQSHVGALLRDDSQLSVDMVINKTFQTDLSALTYLYPCVNQDKSMWIACGIDKVVKRVKPDGNKLKVISSLNTVVHGMAILQSNDVLLSIGGSTLQLLSVTTGKLTDSTFDVDPLLSTGIHITSGNKVVVGGYSEVGRKAVFVMNNMGDHETVYEYDKHNQPIFTYPLSITSTSNGNIHVNDYSAGSDRGRVLVLGQGGDVINTYTGNAEINNDTRFTPGYILTTPRDNVIVADLYTHTLHILDNAGFFMTYHNMKDKGILYPGSLAFIPTGQLYIGCGRPKNGKVKETKMYEVTITGC